MSGIYWQGKSIEDLDNREMRDALRDAVRELHFASQGASSDSFFQTLIVGYLFGAATVVVAVMIGAFLIR